MSALQQLLTSTAPIGGLHFDGSRRMPWPPVARAASYHMVARGDCLGDAYGDQSVFVVEPAAEIHPGDLVYAALCPGGPWHEHMTEGAPADSAPGFVKIFLRRVGDTLLLAQINPPVIAVIDVAEIAALQRISAVETPVADWRKDRRVTEMIGGLRGTDTIKPINPEWRV